MSVEQMARAAKAFLSSVDSTQYAAATDPFDVADHRTWSYLPGPRPGLSMVDMSADQQSLALELVEAGCSPPGADTARRVIELDRVRRVLAGNAVSADQLDGDRFWVRILGDPGGDAPWAWHVNGHHLALHVTVVGEEFTVTPLFIGAEPATVLHGPRQGLRTLADEEELARELLGSLDRSQQESAIVASVAPNDILTRTDPVVHPDQLGGGLTHAEMSPPQRQLLQRLLRCYFDRAPTAYADARWAAVLAADLDAVSFAWAGPDRRGQGHYYRVSGPTFLVEYDNTQDEANHIHTVWRDAAHDWGSDLLASHYAQQH